MRTAQLLGITGVLWAALAQADGPLAPGDAGMRPLSPAESAFHEFRERRLERALNEGKLTPEEAETLRRRWREQRVVPPLERLTPEQREQLRQFAEQHRRDRQLLHDSLSPEQREVIRRLRQSGQLDRQQLFDLLTPEQQQQFLLREQARKQERRRLLRELDPSAPPPRRLFNRWGE